jgi:predicted Zn finger-like uncharacterized protein
MIITCINCNKKFEVEASLIPEAGRLLQCNACNYKWFFEKDKAIIPVNPIKIIKNTDEIKQSEKMSVSKNIPSFSDIELLDQDIKKDFTTRKKLEKNLDKSIKKVPSKDKNSYNLFGLTVVFIITFIALIILLDTFQGPLSKIFPNIELILYSLYETINDIQLFLNDLI